MQKLIYTVVALVAVISIGGFFLPRTHTVEVQVEIDAHAATVFALLNDFRRVADWSPWAESDPNARIEYTGNPRGEGAAMRWDGAIIGTGAQRIDVSRPFEYIGVAVNPDEPGEARSWFDLAPGVGTTFVTQGLEVDYGYNVLGRYFASLFGGVIVREYEVGLQRLKDLAESLPGADFGDLESETMTVEAGDIAYLNAQSEPTSAAMAAAMGQAYFQILRFMDLNELEASGAPLVILKEFSGSLQVFDAAIPIAAGAGEDLDNLAGVKTGKTYAGHVLRVSHIGGYDQLDDTHRKISAYLVATGIRRNGNAWESFVTDPGDVAESELLTYLYYPIQRDRLESD